MNQYFEYKLIVIANQINEQRTFGERGSFQDYPSLHSAILSQRPYVYPHSDNYKTIQNEVINILSTHVLRGIFSLSLQFSNEEPDRRDKADPNHAGKDLAQLFASTGGHQAVRNRRPGKALRIHRGQKVRILSNSGTV